MMKKIAVAMVAAGGLLVAAMPAHAGGHVSLSLGVGLPIGVYAAPAPSYYGPPAPTYYAPPAPAYYGPPAVRYDAPYPVYYGPRYYGPRFAVRGDPYWHRGYDHGYRGYRDYHGGHDDHDHRGYDRR